MALLQTLAIRVLVQKIPSKGILLRVGIPRSEAGACRLRTRTDSRVRADSLQGSVGSLSPDLQARELRGETVEAHGNLPSHDIDEESARASMKRREVDAEISSTRNCTQNTFDYDLITSAVRSGMSPAKKLPKLLGAREGDIRVFLDSLAKLENWRGHHIRDLIPAFLLQKVCLKAGYTGLGNRIADEDLLECLHAGAYPSRALDAMWKFVAEAGAVDFFLVGDVRLSWKSTPAPLFTRIFFDAISPEVFRHACMSQLMVNDELYSQLMDTFLVEREAKYWRKTHRLLVHSSRSVRRQIQGNSDQSSVENRTYHRNVRRV